MLDQTLSSLGTQKVVAVMYHMNWPSPGNDPWYFNNPSENNTRRYYYGVNGIPNGYIDGTLNIGSYSTGWLTNAINSRYTVPSPYELEIAGDPGTASVSVKVKATAAPPSGSKYLRIAIVEREYDSPTPFPNGTTHHEYCMLDMVPDGTGTLLNIAVGDSQTFNFNYNTTQVNFHPPSGLGSLLNVVAFVQNDQTKEVMQAAYQEIGINTGAVQSSALIAPSSSATLTGYAYNKSGSAISVDIGLNGAIPFGWSVSASAPGIGSIPLNGGTVQVNIAGQDSFKYNISVDPLGNSGYLSLDADISLSSNPNLSGSTAFAVCTDDLDALVLDANEGDHEMVYVNSLASVFSGTYGVVGRDALHAPGVDLSNFDLVIWSAGITVPAFYTEEVTVLQTYLDNGGRLFIAGQDIGADVFEPTGQSQFAQSFYNNYLHADYVANSSFLFLVKGIAGDPIGDGLQFVLGSVYEKSPDSILPHDNSANPFLQYFNGPKIGGLRSETTAYRVVYMAMGLEQIDQASTRDTLMARTISWLTAGISGIGDHPLLTETFALEQNYPNPFNPQTTIAYSLDNIRPESTTLTIYDALGQKVRTLVDEKMSAGQYSIVWNGRDDRGNLVASGVYYYRLINGQKQAVNKMLYLR